jgi:NAD(P)-dependent dehydrogenase (short-subunit alcohol dehydrogenase family)
LDANRSAYSATKWALIGFTNTLSIELGEFGPHADSAGRAVEDPRIQRVLEDRAKVSGKSVEEEKKSGYRSNRSNGLSIRAILRH